MNFELIVFDWDGTLVDSEARIVTCVQCAFADQGLEPPPPEVAREVIGLSLEHGMLRLAPEVDEDVRAGLVAAYRRHFLGNEHPASQMFPGAVETLRSLRERGYLLAVATGKGRTGLDRGLRDTGLGELFHATRCADEAHSKPHPQMLLELMDELGTRAQDTLMVGDTEFDMQMAMNAGTSALAVCYGVHAPERLMQQGALGCVDSLGAIPPWLEENAGLDL